MVSYANHAGSNPARATSLTGRRQAGEFPGKDGDVLNRGEALKERTEDRKQLVGITARPGEARKRPPVPVN